MSSLNNKPPRKSVRLATKNNPQYELAARSALTPGSSSSARNYKKQKTVTSNNDNLASQTSETVKPLVPPDVKQLILNKHGRNANEESQNTAPQGTPNVPQQEDIEMHPEITQQEQTLNEPMFFDKTLVTSFAAAALSTYIKGSTINQKKRQIERIFGNIAGFTGAVARIHQQNRYMLAYFTTKQDLEQALQIRCTYREINQENPESHQSETSGLASTSTSTVSPNTPIGTSDKNKSTDTCEKEFYFVDYATIRAPKTQEQIQSEKNRTIQVIDIPLNIATPTIRACFDRYGTIENMHTRTRGLFQQAYITYTETDAIVPFLNNTWTVFIMKYAVRVLPLTLSEDQRIIRKDYCIKLAGFSPGTTARDLHPILKEVEAKTCFIPRNPNNYRSLNYAYINFEDDEKLLAAVSKEMAFNGYNLYWAMDDMPTCFVCGNPDHIAKNCSDSRNRNTPKYKKLQKLYNRFHPAQHRKSKTTYANAVKNKKNKNKQVGDQPTIEEFNNIVNALKQANEQIRLLQFQVQTLRQEIDKEKKKNSKTLTKSLQTGKHPVPPVGTLSTSDTISKPSVSTSNANTSAKSTIVNKRVAKQAISSSSEFSSSDNAQLTQPPLQSVEQRQEAIEKNMSMLSQSINFITTSFESIKRQSFGKGEDMEEEFYSDAYDDEINDNDYVDDPMTTL